MNEITNSVGPFILSVDDDAAVLYSRQMILQAAGYNVLSASDGKQALGFFAAVLVDLVVLDYAMPGMNGGAVARLMKARRPLVPIVLVSGLSIDDETATCVDCCFNKGEGALALLLKRIGQLLALRSSE